ncbi:MAG: hypothetical protein IJP52_05410 [Paludibacteraceae bacterium]|nr:hypothetical protein [Paludibacteraceae bacterium]
MRKIYSILLIACSMLISANIQAQNVAKIVGGDEYATVEEAFEAAATGETIQLIGAAAEVLQNEVIVINDGRVLTLDLNGKTLTYGKADAAKTAANPQNFVLTKGDLTIKNGTVKNETPVRAAKDFKNENGKQIIVCYMSGDNVSTTTNFSKLTVAADAMLYTEKGKSAISIDQSNAGGLSGYGVNPTAACAFGTVVDVYGTVYGDKYGIQISGNLAGYDANDPGAPFIHIHSGALAYANPNATTGCGVYMGGVGVCIVEGTVHGATGLYVKSGKVDVINGTIYSDATSYTKAKPTNSGADAAGSAIVVESNKGYDGHHDVTISGDSKITGKGGYGIEETVTNSDTTKVTSIKFVGGTIESGNQGAIVVDKGTISSTDETGEKRFTVVGGNTGSEIKVNDSGNVKDTTITAFTPNNDTENNYVTSTVTVGDKEVIVVTKVEKTEVIDQDDNNSVVGAAENTSVVWKNSTTTSETLTANKSLHYLEINQNYNQTLTIPEGKKLTVQRVVMGNKAKIVVEAGAKLIVTGEQGIVAPSTSNIELQANADAQATFVISPAVTSNRQPYASVQFVSKCYFDGSHDVWHRFAAPIEITGAPQKSVAVSTYAQYINDASNPAVWEDINAWTDIKPFMAASLTNSSTTPGVVYTFKGKLMGNVTDSLKRKASTWNYYGNSFMAPMGVQALLDTLPAQNVDGTIYYWDMNEVKFLPMNAGMLLFDEGITELSAMQFFVLRNKAQEKGALNIDYANSIYNYNVNGGSGAPQRIAANNVNRVRINVTAENGASDVVYVLGGNQYSAEYEDGYDAEKLMNEGLNLYVQGDMNYAMLATDEILGTTISMKANEAINYTMTFGKVNGEYALRDNMTGKTIAIVEGATYNFSAQPNEVAENRFEIVNRDAVTTDINTIVGDTNDSKAVYTVLGQYVGETANWNMLPAGIYVVDGVKVVK